MRQAEYKHLSQANGERVVSSRLSQQFTPLPILRCRCGARCPHWPDLWGAWLEPLQRAYEYFWKSFYVSYAKNINPSSAKPRTSAGFWDNLSSTHSKVRTETLTKPKRPSQTIPKHFCCCARYRAISTLLAAFLVQLGSLCWRSVLGGLEISEVGGRVKVFLFCS